MPGTTTDKPTFRRVLLSRNKSTRFEMVPDEDAFINRMLTYEGVLWRIVLVQSPPLDEEGKPLK